MGGANLAFVGNSALFAADAPAAFDFNNLGQILPFVIGGAFTLVVIVVGLVLSAKKSARTQQAEEGSALQPPDAPITPNPLRGLVLPGVALLVIGGVVVLVVVPLFQDFAKAQKNLDAVQSTVNSDFHIPQSPVSQIQPHQYPQPQINIPKIQPTLPRIPQVYIDRRGVIHSR